MASKKENFARFGMAAKGAVYTIIGILTAFAAFGQGGQKAGSKGALQYLAEQSYGQIMLIIMGLGLLGYVFWRMYQVFANPGQFSKDVKGTGKRIGYFISGLIYSGLAYYAFKLALGSGGAGGGSSLTSSITSNNTVAIVVGIGIAIKAIYDLYRAYSGRFREEVQETDMSRREQKVLVNAGKFGHTARGTVLGLMAYLTLKSGFSGGAGVGTQSDAFSYIQDEFGSLVLGIVAIGIIGYGVYMFIMAKYPSIVIDSNR